MKCLNIVVYFKCLTCLYVRVQESCFWEATAQMLTHKVSKWRKPCSHVSVLNSTGRTLQNSLWKALNHKPKLGLAFFFWSSWLQNYFWKGCKHLQARICINTTLLLSRSVLHMQFLGATYFGVIFNIWQSILYCCKLHTVYKYSQAAAADSTWVSCRS